MNQEFFTNQRVLFIIQGCHHCRKIMEFIERINMKLPIDKRIKLVDCTLSQNYGIIDNPLIEVYAKHFDGFPSLFIGSLKIVGANSRIEIESYLTALLEEEFIYPEYSNGKFNKECKFVKSKIFGR